MKMSIFTMFRIILMLCFVMSSPGLAVIIETVPVGNPSNLADKTGGYGSIGSYGRVDYTYKIGKYELTTGQYAEFLNAVAATDTYGLYNPDMWSSSMGCKINRSSSPGSYTYSVAADWANRPVNLVSWGDAARFVNWMHNGQPTGTQNLSTTEDGSYYLNGATSNAELIDVVRRKDATWVIPTEDEWHKAAYHKNDGKTGNYWYYPTSSDKEPSNVLINPDPGNNANWQDDEYTIGAPYYRTEVGEFENSKSPYGTFDQGGNVWEWTTGTFSDYYVIRGWSWACNHAYWRADAKWEYPATTEFVNIGFRVAVVPEPATIFLLGLGVPILARMRRKR
jgi:sulfatase modifying factor 1